MIRSLAVLLLLAVLGACAAQSISKERRLQIACSSYANLLEALAVRNRLGLVSGAAQERVDEAVLIVAPVCEGRTPAGAGTVLSSVEAALVVMIEERDRASGS